jgi:L-threonylcarbamoyladenylate synthase
MRRLVVDSATVDDRVLHEAARAIGRGGVIAMPTDTLYGLAVDPFQDAAVERLFAVKERDRGRALPLIAADVAQVTRCIGTLPPLAAHLGSRFWPGPLTLLLSAPAALSAAVSAGTSRVGVRVPDHAVARGLCAACGVPLTATSANVSGEPASASPDEIARTLADRIDVLVDAGMAPGGAPSTIVDVTGIAPELVRAGAIPWDVIRAFVRAWPLMR